ncbi:hypothetical protein B0I00_0266 [Novosphingobium kunmingense]|uniref:Uncharacterized protein n=1 Tax=Novosphingobium kunmingense TaxID=1211806 RepID=A0A2N0I1M2_9SPHN|nr:hypothetical protein [Novosphingobium kunmingense]PKB25085.1 hypothetical protein B0I00_0266 [Novosphingobium kunmingense]
MISHGYDTSTARTWSAPRPPMDPSLRLRTYGRIRPLAEDMTWWERIFRR